MVDKVFPSFPRFSFPFGFRRGVVFCLFLFLFPFLIWSFLHLILFARDIRLDGFAGSLERSFAQKVSGYKIDIEGVRLNRSDSGHIALSLENVLLRSAEGEDLSILPEVSLEFLPLKIFSVPFRPLSIEMSGSEVTFIYDRAGRVRVTLGSYAGSPEGRENFSVGDLDQAAEKTDLSSAPALVSDWEDGSGNPTDERQRGSLSPEEIPEFSEAAGKESDSAEGVQGSSVVSDERGNPLSSHVQDFLYHPFSGNSFSSYIHEIHVRRVQATFVHERYHWVQRVRDGHFLLSNGHSGELQIGASLTLDREAGSFITRVSATLREKEGNIVLTGNIREMIADFSSFLGIGSEEGGRISAATSFEVNFHRDGVLSNAALQLDFGSASSLGSVQKNSSWMPGGTVHARYDAATRVFTIDDSHLSLGLGAFVLSGQILDKKGGKQRSDRWDYDFSLRAKQKQQTDLENLREYGEGDREVLVLRGGIDFVRGHFTLDDGRLLLGDMDLKFVADTSHDSKKARTYFGAESSAVEIKDLLKKWPVSVFPRVREWMSSHLSSGRFVDSCLNLDFDWDTLWDGGVSALLQSGKLSFNTRFEDATLEYIPKAPLLQRLQGTMKLSGARLALHLEEGYVLAPGDREVKVLNADLEIPDIRFAIPRAQISMNISAGVPEFFWYLNQPPFFVFQPWNFDISKVGGAETTTLLRLSVPLHEQLSFEDIDVEAVIDLHDVSIQDFLGDRDLHSGEFLVNVRDKLLLLAGRGKSEGRPVDVEVSLPLSRGTGSSSPLEMNVDLDLDLQGSGFLNVSGPSRLTLVPSYEEEESADSGTQRSVVVYADLYRARVKSPALNYSKEPMQEARLLFKLISEPGSFHKVQDMEFYTANSVIHGDLLFGADWSLQHANFLPFTISPGDDASLVLDHQKNGEWEVSLTGKRFDVREILSLVGGSFSRPPSSSGGEDVVLSLQLEEVMGRQGIVLKDLDMRAYLADLEPHSLHLTAYFGQNKPVSLRIEADSEFSRKLLFRSADAGSALRFAGIYDHVESGTLSLTVDLPSKDSSSPISGKLRIKDFVLLGEHARAISSSEQNSGESRVKFDDLYAPFDMKGMLISLRETTLKGFSRGIVIRGNIDLEKETLDLVGTYIPVYVLNNLLEHLPLIGEALVGGDGGGVVGLNFAVRGSSTNPKVIFNPVSLVTPGPLRGLLNFQLLNSGVRKGENPPPAESRTE